ncbi:ATP-binding protein [Agaribacter flavus]|uniref:histidine kinase n=1 Tax=Agaribacter flavus TaxID=1902781 RepID=A0ABV7FTI1_9ALTE
MVYVVTNRIPFAQSSTFGITHYVANMKNNTSIDLLGAFSKSVEEIFAACTAAILLVDENAKIRYCNDAVRFLFGYQDYELVHQSIDLLLPREFRFGHEEMFKRYFISPERRQMGNGTVFPCLNRSGERIDVCIGLNTLTLEGETFVIANITEAQESSEALARDMRRSELLRSRMNEQKRLIQVADASNSSVLITDENHQVTWVNKSLAFLLNKNIQDLIGKSLNEVFSDYREELYDLFQAYEDGLPLKRSFLLNVNGNFKNLSMMLSPTQSQYNLKGNVLYINDTTEFERLQHDLEESSQLLATIAKIAKIGYYTLDIETNELTWSDEVYLIHELPVGIPMDVDTAISFYTNQSRPVIEKAIENSIHTGEPFDLELPFLTAKERDIWVRAVGYIEFKEGKAAMLKGAFQDITHMRLSAIEAERGIRAKSAFLANMSHELRTPINGILGVSEILSETNLSEQQAEYLSVLSKSASTLLSLVNQVLTYAKLEEYPDDVHKSELSIYTLMQQVVFAHKVACERKGLMFSMRIEDDVPEHMMADGEKLEQILNNVLSNAVKFTVFGSISVNITRNSENELVFSVSDTGPGIREEDQEMLFEAFRQLDMSYARQHDGTGLGLAISKALVTNLGGHIGVDSVLGTGSTFWFTLPYELASVKSAQAVSVNIPPVLIMVTKQSKAKWVSATERLNVSIVICENETEVLQQLKQNDQIKIVLLFVEWLTKPLKVVKQAVERLISEQQILLFSYSKRGESAYLEDCEHVMYVDRMPDSTSDIEEQLLIVEKYYEAYMNSSSRKLEGKHLLVVEDNEINQMIFKEMLNGIAGKITIAENGELALTKLAEHDDIDIIVMDCQMPEMDGYECTTIIRNSNDEKCRNLPIIAATAHVLNDEVAKCYSVGMDDVIQKPFNKHQLIKTIANYL